MQTVSNTILSRINTIVHWFIHQFGLYIEDPRIRKGRRKNQRKTRSVLLCDPPTPSQPLKHTRQKLNQRGRDKINITSKIHLSLIITTKPPSTIPLDQSQIEYTELQPKRITTQKSNQQTQIIKPSSFLTTHQSTKTLQTTNPQTQNKT
jgi:hypothetical protein